MADEAKVEETANETAENSDAVVEDAKVEDSTEKTEAAAPEAKAEETKEEPKVEEKKDDASAKASEEKKPAPSGKFKEMIEHIEQMSVLELSELVKTLEDRFGVSAAAPVAVAGGGGAGGGAEEPAEEKTSFTVHLAAAGGNKIAVIKAVREVNNTLGLKEAKDLVDAAPGDVRKDAPKEEAEAAKAKLEEAGATVELR
jgi:large subunit ribosomal protein L7/L12